MGALTDRDAEAATGPRTLGPRRRDWGTRLAIAVAVLLLLAPVGLVVTAPRFAQIPPPVSAEGLPPLPTPASDARRSLDGIVDQLPIVVRDLPDEPSRQVAADWDAAVFSDPGSAATMLDHAWQALRYEAAGGEAFQSYGTYLVFGPTAPSLRDIASTAPPPEATAAMAPLVHDPRNADRLTNVAVALFALGAANDVLALDVPHAAGTRLTDFGGGTLAEGRVLQAHAVQLLAAVEHAFGPHRPARLNAAYFLNAIPTGVSALPSAIPFVDRQLAADPADRTARLLLAAIQARRIDVADGLDRALTILKPFVGDRAAGPLADVAQGDAYLAAASVRPEAPFLARHLARQALNAYDRALVVTVDPGVYAGRAAALALLGAASEAVAAQERAVAVAPDSLPLRLELAALQEAAGDIAGMRESSREVLRRTTAGWMPPLSSIRFVAAPATPVGGTYAVGDRGYLGYSYGSHRDRAGVFRVPEGGAFVVSLDLIPRTNAPNLDDWLRTGPVPKVAAHLAGSAAVLLGDTSPVTEGGVPDPGALLAAGVPLPGGTDWQTALRSAETAFRHAGRFQDAADLCQRVLAEPPNDGFNPVPALICSGESAYLAAFAGAGERSCPTPLRCAGDHPPNSAFQAASADLALAYEEARRQIAGPPVMGRSSGLGIETLRLRALQAAQAAGQIDRARRLAMLAVANTDDSPVTVVTGAAKLGELELEDGDAAGAAEAYDLALAMLEEADNHVWTSGFPEFALLARTLEQRAHLNRGVARLRLSQVVPDAAPDCAGHRQLCLGARDDFAAALASDPRNPVALLNAAWAARLLGDIGGAREMLALAADVDPTLFPALNDLGVLEAENGDLTDAEGAFRSALATNPNYDLAAWNLGVLELRKGAAGILPGQAWLLRSLAHSPSFRGHDLTFKTDERIYRVAFGPDARLGHGWSFGRAYTVAAVALGTVSLLVAVGATLNSVVTGKISEGLTNLGKERLDRAGAFLSDTLRNRPGGEWGRWGPWLVTVPVLALVSGWPAWQDDPPTGAAAAAMALFASAVAVAAHETGHAAAARTVGAKLVPAQWGPGVVMALLLLPLRLSSGPFPGRRVLGVEADRAWWVYLAGPVGNLAVGAAAYALFLAQPAPLLRLVAEAQLAAIGYALLPFGPLDGGPLGSRPAVVGGLGLFVAVAGVLFAIGML